ncbi:hypothetical protein [Candidatus Parabeggiatoa sp. HSG14]
MCDLLQSYCYGKFFDDTLQNSAKVRRTPHYRKIDSKNLLTKKL